MEMLQEQILIGLQQAGLIPPESIYQEARTAITSLGQEVASTVERIVGAQTWSRGLARLQHRYIRDDMRRVLGFGAALTGYTISGLSLWRNSRVQVIELGALANLIVSLYDQFIDTGVVISAPPSYALALGVSKITRSCMKYCALAYPAPTRLLLRLIMLYFDRLDALPFLEQRPQIKQSVLKTIYRMYMAERSTVAGIVPTSKKQLIRKSALPFVVMAMPAWLATERFDFLLYLHHIRWLYHLGLLIGYIDDAVDFIEDQQQGHPNLWKVTTATFSPTERVVHLANMVKMPYLSRDSSPESIVTREALRTCIASWFGGSPVTFSI